MKTLKIKSVLITLMIILSSSCTNDEPSGEIEENKEFAVHQLETEYNLYEFEPQDQLKIVVSEALSNLLINDREYAKNFISNLVDKDGKTKEILYIKENKSLASKGAKSKLGKSLEQLLIDNITPKNSSKNGKKTSERQIRESLIRNAETILPNLVIKIPDWVNSVIENIDLDKLDFAVYAGIDTRIILYKLKRVSDESPFIRSSATLADYIPIQIKESEKLIPLIKGSNTTIWDDNLIDDHFPSLRDCTEFNRKEYIVSTNDEYDFLDMVRLSEDLVNARLCDIDISGRKRKGNAVNAPCVAVYQRDCVTEKNVIEGIRLTNNAVFLEINNQPGGEDSFALHYVFLASQMCGDLSVTRDCPPRSWELVFAGKISDFFEIQTIIGHPLASELGDVIYRSSWFYVKCFPKYYDIPVDLSFEGIYSQVAYLQNTTNSYWDGNVYGSVVSFTVYEHDNVTVKATLSQTVTMTNVTKVSTKLAIKKVFEVGADFSNTVTRSSTHTYTLEASKDVKLGGNASIYFDPNYQNSAIGYGINKTTGTVNTYFAFYY